MTSSTNSNNQKVIVFGATGAIGTHLIRTIAKEQPTWTIIAVSRSGQSDRFLDHSTVNVVKGDPLNKKDVLSLSQDCDLIYCCVGFAKYERKFWAKHWPMVIDNLLEAVTDDCSTTTNTKKKQLCFCDNLYAYGATTNITTSTTPVPPSQKKSKPAIRSSLRNRFVEHMSQHPGTLTVVGGADFFGPLVTNTSFLGDTFTKPIVQTFVTEMKKPKQGPICLGSKTAIHDFCYAPDFAKALYVASVHDEAYDHFWICPHSVHQKSMSDIANDIAVIAAKDKTASSKVTCYPGWSVKLLGVFMSFMKEMVEMLPFWTNDYSVQGDQDFCTTFGIEATPYEEALAEYVAFYKDVLAKEEEAK